MKIPCPCSSRRTSCVHGLTICLRRTVTYTKWPNKLLVFFCWYWANSYITPQVAEVQAFVNDKPQLGFALILQLTGPYGSQQFDKLTKTKTVESILPSLAAKGIQTYINHLFSLIDEPDKKAYVNEACVSALLAYWLIIRADLSATNARRAWIIDQLGMLIRNGKIPKEDAWIQSILNWLVVNGLFIVKKKSSKVSIVRPESNAV